jgi:uncharacterized protein YceH (UPF0502 family)
MAELEARNQALEAEVAALRSRLERKDA